MNKDNKNYKVGMAYSSYVIKIGTKQLISHIFIKRRFRCKFKVGIEVKDTRSFN